MTPRRTAQRAGRTRYTGRRCRKHSKAKRFTSNGCCCACSRKANLATENEYQRRKRRADPQWRQKWNKYRAQWMREDRARNSDKYARRDKAWRERNLNKALAASYAYRARKRGQQCTCCTPDDFRAIYYAARLTRKEVDHRRALALGGLHCCKNLQLLTVAQHRRKTVSDNRKIRKLKPLRKLP